MYLHKIKHARGILGYVLSATIGDYASFLSCNFFFRYLFLYLTFLKVESKL